MPTTIEKKINIIFKLLGYLAEGKELYKQDEILLAELNLKKNETDMRKLDRYLKEIHELYTHIVLTEKKTKEYSQRKVTVYRVANREKDVSKIFKFFIENSFDLNWLLQLVYENDPSLLDEVSDKKELEQSMKQDKDVFLFISNPFEKLTDEQNKLFSLAKEAVKGRMYRDIKKLDGTEFKDAKCLKLMFSNNNWYFLIETSDKQIRFLRFIFLESIRESYQDKRYQHKVLDEYQTFFKNIQNPMTLNIEPKKACLKISSEKAFYFKDSMKPFLPSQTFIKENDDGSVEFSLSYTQPLEILPFIKQWQPHMIILSPNSLRDELLKDMNQGIKNHSSKKI